MPAIDRNILRLAIYEIMMITDGGTLVRTRVADVSQMSRDTQGVKMISLTKDEKLIGLERIEALEGEDDEEIGEQGGEDTAEEPTED